MAIANLGGGPFDLALMSKVSEHLLNLDAHDSLARDEYGQIYPSRKMIRCDLGRPLPLFDQCLRGIFAGEIIEHLFDPELFLSECHRVLEAQGVLVLTTPNLATLQDLCVPNTHPTRSCNESVLVNEAAEDLIAP